MLKLAILLLPLFSQAEQASPIAPESLSRSEREDLYEDHGMEYAKGLYQEQDGSAEDELRSKKSEILNYKIRERGVLKLEQYLAKAKEPRIRKELLHRLSQLHEQQAEISSRRSDIPNSEKESMQRVALRKSNRYLEAIRKEFPSWSGDAMLFNLAENHSKLKEAPVAERYYREVIARYPNSPVVADSLLSLGNLYFERQGFQSARRFYGKILSTPENNLHPYAHYKIAWCYFNENDFHGAVAKLEQSINESRKLNQQKGERKLGVEEEALSDLVLFYAENGSTTDAKERFEKLVGNERANELRFQLAKRLFDYGKHQLAKNVAKQLLDEKPQKEFINKLYLVLISVAERTKDRDFGLDTAEKLSGWIKSEKPVAGDSGRVESEEYLRLYSQKLHHEAETLKQKEVWTQAKKSYEIYLKTFPEETETPEVKFRYSVLLMNRKEQLKAYHAVSEALAKMDNKHARYKEALKLRIQSIELASAEERKEISNKNLLIAYDSYANSYPEEELGIEAKFKAAGVAKNIETPEQTAARYRAIAEAHPKHSLAKASITEALAILVKAERWEALGSESRAFSEKADLQSGLLAKDEGLGKKIAEARELSLVKITEGLESQGKFEEARLRYENILEEKPSEQMGIYSLVRLASLSETKLNKNREAIRAFERLKEKYPLAKESRQASLELARLFEKVNEPRESVRRYLEFSETGAGKLELQALTNAAVLLEKLGDRESAAKAFFQLSENLEKGKNPTKEVQAAYEAGCNNMLLASYQNKEKKLLASIHSCARELSNNNENALLWQARAAWALDQMADNLQTDTNWKKIATRSLKATPEAERAYIAMAKLRILQKSLEDFRQLRFTRTNERPEANIAKKTAALEALEKSAEAVIKVGTAKQILAAKNQVRLAYLDFAEAMETAAVPSKLTDQEKEELKKSFHIFAKDFREKAASLEHKEEAATRTIASIENKNELKLSSLSGEEERWLEAGIEPVEKAAELYAKKAYQLFQDGKYGDARYFSEKWKKALSRATEAYGGETLERFQGMLTEKMPEADPVSIEF
jgi:tetratricopeptide (TPR) repeat protein